jgi:hypothetical protein
MIGTLLQVFIVLCILALIIWGVRQTPGIPPIIIITVVYVIVGVLVLLWLLSLAGGAGLHLTNRL